jgi:peptidoglycan/LPS O-acetylase OafA/YrhL
MTALAIGLAAAALTIVSFGAQVWERPIIAPNAVCFVLAGFILALKLLPRRHRDALADALVAR